MTAAGVRASRRAGARIAVAAARGSAAAGALRRAELNDVRFVELGAPTDAPVDADMLVLVAGDGDAPDGRAIAALARAERQRGTLIAAIVVGGTGDASPLLAALRDAADLVMMVREPDDVRAIVGALR